MDGSRKIDGCINCGEVREIAAHGLCFKCYRKEDRAKERQLIGVDRHNPGIRREHKKMFRGFSSVMTGLSDLAVSKSDVLAIRRVIDPYLDPISRYLAAPSEKHEIDGTVHSEQELRSSSQFTEGQKLKHDDTSKVRREHKKDLSRSALPTAKRSTNS